MNDKNQRAKVSDMLGLGNKAAQKIIEISKYFIQGEYPPTLIDIGGGSGRHSNMFAGNGFKVTYNDIYKPEIYRDDVEYFVHDFNTTVFEMQWDIVWASHVLEHQLNVNKFLDTIALITKENGLIAITVPPAKSQIVSGHYTTWNAGMILYNMVMAGIDCSNPMILEYGYNISVIVQYKPIILPKLEYDYGDLTALKEFFPPQLVWIEDSFDGNIKQLNWE